MCIINNLSPDIFLYIRPFSVRSTTFSMHDLKSYAYFILFFFLFYLCLICSFFLYDESAPGIVSTYRGIFAAVATNRNGITKNRHSSVCIDMICMCTYIESSALDSVPGSLSSSPVYDSRLRLNSTFCLPYLTFFKCCCLCFADKKYAHLLCGEA